MRHYQEIVNVYKAIQSLWNAVNKITNIPDQGYNALVSLEQTGKKLMYNAYRYGISTATSSKYRDNINSLADAFTASVYKIPEVARAAASPMRALRNALNNYTPTNLPPQVKKKPEEKNVKIPEKIVQNPMSGEDIKPAAFKGKPVPDVKIDTPREKTLSPKASPSEVLKHFFNRDVIAFYSIPKWKYEDDKSTFDRLGYTYIHGLGIIPKSQMGIAQKIMSEDGWIKHPYYGYLNKTEQQVLKSNGFI